MARCSLNTQFLEIRLKHAVLPLNNAGSGSAAGGRQEFEIKNCVIARTALHGITALTNSSKSSHGKTLLFKGIDVDSIELDARANQTKFLICANSNLK